MPTEISRVPYIKAHRVGIFTFPTANLWTDVIFDVVSETNKGGLISLAAGIFTYHGDNDVLIGTGCLRPRRTGGATAGQSIAARVMVKQPGGEFIEARCMQNAMLRNWPANDVTILPLLGTVAVQPGTQFKVQARVSVVDIQLEGWPEFDSPVAASIAFTASGSFV